MSIDITFFTDRLENWGFSCHSSVSGVLITVLEVGLYDLAEDEPTKQSTYEVILERFRYQDAAYSDIKVAEVDKRLWPILYRAIDIGWSKYKSQQGIQSDEEGGEDVIDALRKFKEFLALGMGAP